MWGLQPLWFHVVNVALHLLASLLFTRVCVSVAGLRTGFATLAGLLFAAHPIHTEAVSTRTAVLIALMEQAQELTGN